MQAIKRILVVIDPTQQDQLALNRARLIAGFIDSELHLLICDDRGDHQRTLDQQCAELKAAGIPATSSQAWHGNMTDTVIQVLGSKGCGLVIKQHLPDKPLKKALLTPDDWKLLRYCPAPVLLVKTTASWIKGNVLAAVDVGNHDDQHRVLHDTIVSHAADIVDMIGGELHLVSAHPAPMLSAADPIYQLRENIANRYREEAQRYAIAHGLDMEHMHVDEGPADTLIPKVARHIGASVTLIGTVARKGIAGALIGNTAEVILDQLESDILVLKPEDTLAHLENILQR